VNWTRRSRFLSTRPATTPARIISLRGKLVVDLGGYRACKRCGRVFRVLHGNQVYCGLGCRRPWPARAAKWVASAPRFCELCGVEYVPTVWHQKFCSPLCGERVRDAVGRVKYRDQTRRRAVWRARVASGTVRCARGGACRFAEDGVGGLIRPCQLWDLGHADGESAGGPEHRSCNRSAPQRLRARGVWR
jgi:hypothetical protein